MTDLIRTSGRPIKQVITSYLVWAEKRSSSFREISSIWSELWTSLLAFDHAPANAGDLESRYWLMKSKYPWAEVYAILSSRTREIHTVVIDLRDHCELKNPTSWGHSCPRS